MPKAARRLATDDEGATSIEYALLAALIAGVVISAVGSLGQTLGGLYGGTNTELVEHMQGGPSD